MCARKFEFSIFSLTEKADFKLLEGAQSAKLVPKNFFTKNICIFWEKNVGCDKKGHNDRILWYLKEFNPKKFKFRFFDFSVFSRFDNKKLSIAR